MCCVYTSRLISPKQEFTGCTESGTWHNTTPIWLLWGRKSGKKEKPNPGCCFCSTIRTFFCYFPQMYSITATSTLSAQYTAQWRCLDFNWWNYAATNLHKWLLKWQTEHKRVWQHAKKKLCKGYVPDFNFNLRVFTAILDILCGYCSSFYTWPPSFSTTNTDRQTGKHTQSYKK